jgi:N-acetylglutamate synthase-like GNAT family acetyltransferase
MTARGGVQGIEIYLLDDGRESIALGVAAGLEYTEGDDEGLVARWGAHDDGRLIGTVALCLRRGMAIVSWMAVDEKYRGRGIGRLLMKTLEQEAVARGADRLWTTARAPGFYWANGFEPLDPGEPADFLLGPCLQCEQYGASCHPVAAAKALGRPGGDAADPGRGRGARA